MSRTTDAIIDRINEEAKEPKWFLLVANYGFDGDQEFINCYSSREEAESKVIKTSSSSYTITDREHFNFPIMCNNYQIIDLREWVYQ